MLPPAPALPPRNISLSYPAWVGHPTRIFRANARRVPTVGRVVPSLVPYLGQARSVPPLLPVQPWWNNLYDNLSLIHVFHINHDVQQHGTLTYTHAQQYQSWKDTPSHSPIAGNIRQFIPQRMYKPHTGSDRRRYVEQVPLSPPIIFEVDHPCEWGIDLDDALKCRTKRLVDRDALMFEGCGPSVSIRLEVRTLFFYFVNGD